jgi:hypothetical protein
VRSLPALPFSYTLQGVILAQASANGALLLTNAIEVASPGCACPL